MKIIFETLNNSLKCCRTTFLFFIILYLSFRLSVHIHGCIFYSVPATYFHKLNSLCVSFTCFRRSDLTPLVKIYVLRLRPRKFWPEKCCMHVCRNLLPFTRRRLVLAPADPRTPNRCEEGGDDGWMLKPWQLNIESVNLYVEISGICCS